MVDTMRVPGLTILHELLHWHDEVITFDHLVLDYGRPILDGTVWKVDGVPLENGYGSSNAWVLNFGNAVDTSMNADSYVWMAVEAWHRALCPGRDMAFLIPGFDPMFLDEIVPEGKGESISASESSSATTGVTV